MSSEHQVDTPWTAPATAVTDASQRLRLLVDAVTEYAIFLLAPDGTVMTWNPGAERLKGYAGPDIVGQNFSVFYPAEDIAAGKPARELAAAERDGKHVDDGWRVRKDGTRFWAHVTITALIDGSTLRGFAKVTRDDTAARAAAERGRAMQEVTHALLGRADPSEILTMLTGHARNLTGAGRAWLATPQGHHFAVRAADGTVPGPEAGALLPADPRFAKVMAAGEGFFIDNLPVRYPHIPELGALGAGMVVPLTAGSDTSGVLVAAAPKGAPTFRPADLELLQAFANQAELVLSYAHAQQVLREQQLGNDRERIARDLHDHVIQQLFATGLMLQSTALITRDNEIRGRIEGAVDSLDTTIRQIRTTIFDLHERQAPETLREHVVSLVTDAARGLNFTPEVTFDGPVESEVGAGVREHVLAALREMLSNVARHANASSASVSVSAGDELVLAVTDDGGGVPDGSTAGSGLGNLQERASSLGGSFTLESGFGCGAVATWRIPL